jgi:hypothetical protein
MTSSVYPDCLHVATEASFRATTALVPQQFELTALQTAVRDPHPTIPTIFYIGDGLKPSMGNERETETREEEIGIEINKDRVYT